MARLIQILAILAGGFAVAIGAMGAHMLSDPQAKQWVTTGAHMALPHAAVVLWAARAYPVAALLMALGAALFSGTLYALAFGAPRVLAQLAPVGGTMMILGWVFLLVGVLKARTVK